MEKFNLKWNDFLLNLSTSFGILRKEEEFYDVSLVCDDEQILSAHKVVLSASSDLFKRKADHSKPMIYLNGVSSKELNNILDYIYEGEVGLFQDELDNFLAVAEKLKINGLVGGDNEYVNDEEGNDEIKTFNQDSEKNSENPPAIRKRFQQGGMTDEVDMSVRKLNKTVAVVVQTGDNNVYDKAKRAVDAIVMKSENGWTCKTCGKTTKGISSSQIRKHAEIHIEGLRFPCQLCGNTFRSREALKCHKTRH